MELFREEARAKLGINWGKIVFQRSCTGGNIRYIPSPSGELLEVLLEHTGQDGTADLSPVINDLSSDLLARLFKYYNGCHTLSVQGWKCPSAVVLRSLSLALGPSLLVLDISDTPISDEQFGTLIACTTSLQRLLADKCINLGGVSFQKLPMTLKHCLAELSLSLCSGVNNESFLWLTGSLGHGTPSCSKLRLLDIAGCTKVGDAGIKAIATRLHSLQFLNLGGCTFVSDRGISCLAEGCRKLEVLNLENLYLLTDSSIVQIGRNCDQLISLNLANCAQVTDVALVEIAQGCQKLQALNVAGLNTLTEKSFGSLASNCPGLLMLNATGCPELSGTGLNAMVQGLRYVELATSYCGFKPINEVVAARLTDQLEMIHERSATKIQAAFRNMRQSQERTATGLEQRLNFASSVVTRAIRHYGKQLAVYRKLRQIQLRSATLLVQRVWRGFCGRGKAYARRNELKAFQAMTLQATKVQARYRSHFQQAKHPEVARAIQQLRFHKQQEGYTALAVRIQSIARARLAKIRFSIAIQYFARVTADQVNATVVIQSVARMFIAKLKLRLMQLEQSRIFTLHSKAATRIQQFVRASFGRYSASLRAAELRLMRRARLKAAITVQKYFRAHVARDLLYRLKALQRAHRQAAIAIQRVFRGSRVMRYRAIRMNVVTAHVLDRALLEHHTRTLDCRERYRHSVEQTLENNSSDEELEQGQDWHEIRVAYGVYSPLSPRASVAKPDPSQLLERIMVGKKVRILSTEEGTWGDGVITSWSSKKQMHRVKFDDGVKMWISIEASSHQIQVWNSHLGTDDGESGVWVMYDMYRPEERQQILDSIRERKAKEKERLLAWQHASQWQVPRDDHTKARVQQHNASPITAIRWISSLTGEIRFGSVDCEQWVVVADESGWPCFVNNTTGQSQQYDPRFETDPAIEEAKEYMMQDLRYVAYICRDLVDRHHAAPTSEARTALRNIQHSDYRKRLNMLVLRAKDLFKQTSVTDPPLDPAIAQEIRDYADLSATLTSLADLAFEKEVKARQITSQYISEKPEQETVLICPYCKHETERRFYFCQACGKQQGELETQMRVKTHRDSKAS